MKNRDTIEEQTEKEYRARDRRKRKRMKVSGKSVLLLQRLMEKSSAKKLLRLKKKL